MESLIDFMRIIGEHVEPTHQVHICRDAADDYLLALAIEAHANYLVTGDQDLLVLHNIGDCQIVDVVAFEHKISRTRL